MIRKVLIVLAFLAGLGACTNLGNEPVAQDIAVINAYGTWDVKLTDGSSCSGLSALRAVDAIALCRYILGRMP